MGRLKPLIGIERLVMMILIPIIDFHDQMKRDIADIKRRYYQLIGLKEGVDYFARGSNVYRIKNGG